ncbi:MAG: HEAT repeat domain-containing protein [Acidobacteria bacterium]|nr:HEAT repeat domain-containing protein [Acidobacteriota bacterium]
MNKIVFLVLAGALCSPAQTLRTPADLDRALAQISAFEYGQNRDALHEVSDYIRASLKDPKALADVESRFVAMLGSKATLAGKDFACRQLSVIGTEASVPALAGMLGQTETANMALYALARIPGAKADEAIRQALPKSSGAAKVAVINALGHRRDRTSVPALKGLVFSNDAAIAGAAIAALGEIGDGKALQALSAARTKLSGNPQLRATEAYVRGAGKLAGSGETGAALRVYKELLAPREPVAIRVAALSGISKCAGGDAIPILAGQLT